MKGYRCDMGRLELILIALEQSEPKAKHYPEPVERHSKAIAAVLSLLAEDTCFEE
jgi:hypothetical protein